MSAADAAAAKSAGMAGGVVAAAPAIILGIEIGTLTAATVGALLSLAYSRPESWANVLQVPEGPAAQRVLAVSLQASKIALTMAAIAIVSAWAVTAAFAAAPHIPAWALVAQLPQPPLAGLLAFAAQHLLPLVPQLLRALVGRFAPGGPPK